jgi:hydrogenase nickel incorporation protein HypA/HybF
MHESGFAGRIVEVALERAREAGAARVTDLHVELGPKAGFAADSVAFHLEEASRGTIVEGARIHFLPTTDPRALRLVSIDVEDPPERTA